MSDIKVMVLDDDPSFLRLTRTRLVASGFVVVTGENWTEVMPILKAEQPDVALLDLKLQTLDGDAITPLIKKWYPSTRVILYSSADVDTLERAAREAGADAFVPKSASAGELVTAIEKVLA